MDKIVEGHYSRKQLGCRSQIIAWSHGARFKKALHLAGSEPGGKLLDYGCGDGTFIGMVAGKFGSCVGADVSVEHVSDCQQRLAPIPNARFCMVRDLTGAGHDQAYQVVTCMETLEHCVEPVADQVLADLGRLCHPDGRVIISVPIEIGPTFLFKYPIRKVAGWRGLSDYRYYESYPLRDAARMLFATSKQGVRRPVYGEAGQEYHSHYGFNWRWLRQKVSRRLFITKTLYSPLGILGGWVSSQAWFICRPKRQQEIPGT